MSNASITADFKKTYLQCLDPAFQVFIQIVTLRYVFNKYFPYEIFNFLETELWDSLVVL